LRNWTFNLIIHPQLNYVIWLFLIHISPSILYVTLETNQNNHILVNNAYVSLLGLRLGSISNKNFLCHGSGSWKSKSKVSGGLVWFLFFLFLFIFLAVLSNSPKVDFKAFLSPWLIVGCPSLCLLIFSLCVCVLISFFFSFFAVPGFELRAYTLSHSTSPFL
jgi:hypothetical protein